MLLTIMSEWRKLLFFSLVYFVYWGLKSESNSNVLPELPIVIVTSAHNNAPWVIKYLDSVFMQKYHNFRVIYIDDASSDGAAEIVAAYTRWHRLGTKVTFIKNDIQKLKLENIYKTIHACNDTDIILILDGDDWFAHENVLANINKTYQAKDAWFVYGQTEFFDDKEIGSGDSISKDILLNREFRKSPWIFKHPVTFYAWLFKLVRLKDLLGNEVPLFEGKFYPNCNDRAMIYPMLEMAQYHVSFIPEVAVIQNRFNPLSSQNIRNQQMGPTPTQIMCYRENTIRPIQHAPLERPIVNRMSRYVRAKADCLILSDNNAQALKNLLNSLKSCIQEADNYVVIYQADSHKELGLYEELQRMYTNVQFFVVPFDFHVVGAALKNQHVLLLNGVSNLTIKVDCNYAIRELESTAAYGFYSQVSTKLLEGLNIPYQHVGQGLYAWKFVCDKKSKLKVRSLNGSLYRKNLILDVLSKSYTAITELKGAWESVYVDTNNIGLFVST